LFTQTKAGNAGNYIIHVITGEEILYFPIPHNTPCFPLTPPHEILHQHRCEMFLGSLHIPKDNFYCFILFFFIIIIIIIIIIVFCWGEEQTK